MEAALRLDPCGQLQCPYADERVVEQPACHVCVLGGVCYGWPAYGVFAGCVCHYILNLRNDSGCWLICAVRKAAASSSCISSVISTQCSPWRP